MVSRYHRTLNKANSFDTKVSFLDSDLFITNGKVDLRFTTKDRQEDFNFEIINVPFQDGGILRPLTLSVYTQVWINTNFQRKIVNIFLPIIFIICFGCSFEYPQYMFLVEKKEIYFSVNMIDLDNIILKYPTC